MNLDSPSDKISATFISMKFCYRGGLCNINMFMINTIMYLLLVRSFMDAYLYALLMLMCCDAEHKYEIVKRLQARKHICGMTGDGVNDAPALKKADIGIAVADATDAARSASDIVLTEPGLSVIISAVLTSRAIFQRMKNYTVSLGIFHWMLCFY